MNVGLTLAILFDSKEHDIDKIVERFQPLFDKNRIAESMIVTLKVIKAKLTFVEETRCDYVVFSEGNQKENGNQSI